MPDPAYNPNAIFDQNSTIDPICIEQAICTIIRTTPIDLTEPKAHTSRRMVTAMRALAALHPRDEIEIMLGVQALCAYHAATACWRLAATPRLPEADKSRHISKAATAVRTFDTLLKALERRQAKPMTAAPRIWPPCDLEAEAQALRRHCGIGEAERAPPPTEAETETMTDDQIVEAWAATDPKCLQDENDGLDIANTEGILPNGGMLVPEDPTPQQAAYIARRLMLTYLREKQENDRNGIEKPIVFRPMRTGDLIP